MNALTRLETTSADEVADDDLFNGLDERRSVRGQHLHQPAHQWFFGSENQQNGTAPGGSDEYRAEEDADLSLSLGGAPLDQNQIASEAAPTHEQTVEHCDDRNNADLHGGFVNADKRSHQSGAYGIDHDGEEGRKAKEARVAFVDEELVEPLAQPQENGNATADFENAAN
ncbi:MAG: hypothetical protein WC028_22265 [Candidatus Obscuribacterales bacterium]